MEYYKDFNEFEVALRTQIERDLKQFNAGLEFDNSPGYRCRVWTISTKDQPPITLTQLRSLAPTGEIEIIYQGIPEPLRVTLEWTSLGNCRPLLDGTPTTVAQVSQRVLSACQ